jgi:hypothetical protein
MKKLVFTALIALSLFVARPSHKDIPGPDCDPCPFVR